MIFSKTDTNRDNILQKLVTKLASHREKIKSNTIKNILWKLGRAFLLIGMSFILIYPVLTMLSHAFRPPEEMVDPSVVWIPKQLTLHNIRIAMTYINYTETLKNTIILSTIASIIQLISCSFIGYGFARFNFKGKNIIFALVLFTIIVPQQTYMLPLYVQYRYFDFFGLLNIYNMITGNNISMNLLNSRWTYYMPSIFGAGIRSGLFIYIFRQFFKNMSKDLENAAKIDGSGPYRTFLTVMAPNAIPAFLSVFLFSLVWHWNDFVMSSVLLQHRNRTLAALVGAVANWPWGRGQLGPNHLHRQAVYNAMAFLMIAPVLLVYLVAQKYFVESLDRTGIKG